ncbi:MAG: hypothetical protein RLZZ301_1530 [Bacteroidota bacterium]
MSKNLQFIVNSSELGAGTRGASLGPEAIRAAARQKGSTLFADYKVKHVTTQNDLLDLPTAFPFAKRIDGLQQVAESLHSQLQACYAQNAIPFILAGDHSSAASTLAALKKQFPAQRIGVLWIDAHADIHTPFTTPSGNVHGMPLAAALGLDQQHLAKNEPDAQSLNYWSAFKSSSILPTDLVYIAVRDTEAEENATMAELQLRNYSVAELRQKGLQACFQEIEGKLQACELLYISFDVDSMDPSESSYGTGTPVPNGLSFAEDKEILIHFSSEQLLCEIDFV